MALAHILTEDLRPPESFWKDQLISSRLFQYEIWTRLHRQGIAGKLASQATDVMSVVDILEMSPDILESLPDGFGKRMRTLDAIHLATMRWLLDRRKKFTLASYDNRLVAAARSLGIKNWSI